MASDLAMDMIGGTGAEFAYADTTNRRGRFGQF